MITYVGNSNGGGTGFQVKAPSGKEYILTNKHVCKIKNPMGYVDVYDTEGNKNTLKVLHEYKNHDLCLIEPHPDLRPISVASNIYRTERVYLIGHPRLIDLTFEKGYYRGDKVIRILEKCQGEKKDKKKAVNALEEVLQLLLNRCYERYTTHSFNLISYGGNSGSPIIDVYGNLVSVLFAGSPSFPNFTYGVPLEEIHEFLSDK